MEPGLTSLARLSVSYDEGGEGLGDPADVAQVGLTRCGSMNEG